MNDLERQRKMASQIAGSFDDEPDVTPKTESGRALLAKKHRAIPTSESGERYRDETLTAILAIEQEAASKAVAEVLDRLRKTVDDPEVFIETDWRYRNGWLDAVLAGRALIASERKP